MKNYSTKIIITFALIAIVIVVGLVVLFGNNFLDNNNQSGQVQSTQTPSPTIANNSQVTRTPGGNDDNNSDIPEDWQSYSSDEHNFSIMYPPDIDIEQRERNAVRFTKWGPTQREGTELFDAISLTFNSGSLGGESLESFVMNKIEEERESPVSEVTSDLRETSVSNINGFEYEVASLGESTHIYLPNRNNRYLLIINGTKDPENQGFSETVEQMLSTIETGI